MVFCVVALNALFLRRCRGNVFQREPSGIVVGQSGGTTLANIVSSTLALHAVHCRNRVCRRGFAYVRQQSGSDSSVLNVTLALGMLVAAGGLALVWDKVRGRLSFPAVYTAVFLCGDDRLFCFCRSSMRAIACCSPGWRTRHSRSCLSSLMVTCIKIAHLRQVDPIAVFGVFSSIVYGGVLIGRAVGDALGRTYDISQILVIALMSTYVLSFAGVVVNMRRKGKG